MNILVFADSHGDVDVMADAVGRWRPDQVLHLGDHFSDMVKLHLRFPEIPMQGVRGNCDASGSPEKLRLTLGGVTMLLVHGHRQGVKEDLERLYFTALEAEADLALFGHTHRPFLERRGELLIMNPGSIGRCPHPGYGLLLLEDGRAEGELRTL